jgi:hypothetical protein
MMCLAGHRAEPAHLPEQPLIDLDPGALVRRIEAAELAAEILQDRARFEDRDRLPAGPFGSMMAGMRLFGAILRNSGSNCSPLPIFT